LPGRTLPNLLNHAPTHTPAVGTRTMPTYVGLTSPALPRTPTNSGPSTQALALHWAPRTNPPQHVSPAVSQTANFHQTRHPCAPTPTPATNTRGTPTSVRSASPSLPRIPPNLRFSTSAVDHFRLGLSIQAVDHFRLGFSTQAVDHFRSSQSETVLRFRDTARIYRAFAETLHLSGDIQGSANAIARADSQDYKAQRLQYKNTHQRRRRAEKRASSWQENNYRRQANDHSRQAENHSSPVMPPQNPPVRVDSLEPKSPSPDNHREENNASEKSWVA
jgi:hypothetical protein